MLKHGQLAANKEALNQPPSGGCVLKQYEKGDEVPAELPAAFGRLCVETSKNNSCNRSERQPPSGGCVLKQDLLFDVTERFTQPPSGGCVLKR